MANPPLNTNPVRPCSVWAKPADDASELGPCVLSSQERPTSAAILDALNTAKPAMEARARELEGKGDGSKQWWER